MATLNSVVTASSLKSEMSKIARVMNHLNMDDAVAFVVRDPSTKRRSQLYYDLQANGNLISRLPVGQRSHPKAHRMLVICRFDNAYPLYVNIRNYRAELKHVFGDTCRYAVRAYHRSVELV